MKKTIGVTCDDYKKEKFRKRLIERKFTIIHDKPLLCEGSKVHLFKVEVNEDELQQEKKRLQKVLQELEIEIKQSN